MASKKTQLVKLTKDSPVEWEYTDEFVIVFECLFLGVDHPEYHAVEGMIYKNIVLHQAYGENGYSPGCYALSHLESGLSLVTAWYTPGEAKKVVGDVISLDALSERAALAWQFLEKETS